MTRARLWRDSVRSSSLGSRGSRALARRIRSVVRAATHGLLGTTVALTLAALAWGFVNFGVLLWLPSALVAEGRSVGLASGVMARSALLAAPTIILASYLYSTLSTKWSLMGSIALTTLGLLAVMLRSIGTWPILSNPIVPLCLLIVGSSGVISMLLPYAAENYPVRVRGRATGWVAGWSKVGGVIAQVLSVLGLVPALGTAAAFVAVWLASPALRRWIEQPKYAFQARIDEFDRRNRP